MSEMGLDALAIDLKSMLMDSAERFDARDFERQLNHAAADLSRVRPRVVQAELTLAADQNCYAAPSDLVAPIALDWGVNELRSRMPWETSYIGPIPRLSVLTISGVKQLMLTPAPTQHQVGQLGTAALYRYSARYTIGEKATDTTVEEKDRHLLLIRALADAMQDLASRGVSKPVTLGGKAGISAPRNGSPAALAEDLMQRFETLAQ